MEDDPNGTAASDATAGAGGAIVYNWTRLDALYDGIIAAGVTPIVELSFMPSAIADCPKRGCRT